MGIKTFISSLLLISISLFIATIIFTPIQNQEIKEVPEITFKNSMMYDINDKTVTQLMEAETTYHYKNRDELYNATVILKSEDKDTYVSDTITADFIEVTKDFLKFKGNVNYHQSTGTSLQSEELIYNRILKNLTGEKEFIAFYNGNKLEGNSLSIQKDKTIFKSKDNKPVKINITMTKDK